MEGLERLPPQRETRRKAKKINNKIFKSIMKKLLQLKTMLLLCLMVVGVGNAWGTEGDTHDFSQTLSQLLNNGNSITSINIAQQSYPVKEVIISYTHNKSLTGDFVTASVSVGGDNWGSNMLTCNTTTTQSFSGSSKTGAIVISFTNPRTGTGQGTFKVTNVRLVEGASAPAYTITAQSNNNSYGTVSLSGSVITGSPASGCRYATPAYTVTTGTATVSQNGDAFTVNPSSDCTVTINFEAIPTHTAHFSVNGAIDNNDDDTVAEGSDITFPDDPDDINGKTFVGWVTTPIVGTTNVEPSFVSSATMSTSDITYYAVFATAEGSEETKQDALTSAVTGITTSSYSDFSNKTVSGGSSAVYAGNCAGSNSYIQLRTSSNTGLVSTTSGGKAKKVTVAWNSTTDRAIQVYGSNNAYTELGDIFNDSKKGTLLGTLTYNSSTELTISGNYAYIGIKPDSNKSGASQLSSIKIDWEVSSITYSAYATTVSSLPVPTITFKDSEYETITSLDITAQDMEEVNVECSAGAVTVTVTSDDDTIAEYGEGYVMGYKYGTATLTATFAGNGSYQGTTATLTVNVAKRTTTTTVEVDIDDTDIYTATEGGLAAATVKDGGNTVSPAAVTWTSSATNVATIANDGTITLVGVGTTTITASYAGTDVYAPSEGTYELTLTSSEPQNTGFTINLNSTTLGSTAPDGKTVTVNNVSVKTNTGSASTALVATTDCVKMYKNSNMVVTAPSGYYLTDIVFAQPASDTKWDGDPTVNTGTYTSSSKSWSGSANTVTFTFSGGQCRIASAAVTLAPTVTITAAKYATYCSPHKLDFSETGITVYKAKVNGSVVKMTEISDGIVPANTGVILYKDVDAATTIAVPVTTTDATITDNELVGTTVRTLVAKQSGDNFNYILQNGQDGIVFNMATTEGAYMPANRAYLSTAYDASAVGARLMVVFDEGDTTGIDTVNSEKVTANSVAYDLQGRRVENPKKGGLYIVNGKKVVVK